MILKLVFKPSKTSSEPPTTVDEASEPPGPPANSPDNTPDLEVEPPNFDDLPSNVWTSILRRLGGQDVFTVGKVSRSLRAMVKAGAADPEHRPFRHVDVNFTSAADFEALVATSPSSIEATTIIITFPDDLVVAERAVREVPGLRLTLLWALRGSSLEDLEVKTRPYLGDWVSLVDRVEVVESIRSEEHTLDSVRDAVRAFLEVAFQASTVIW